MLAKVRSCALVGLDGELVEVEVDVSQAQLPSFTIVGLPDAAVQEAKERVRTAIRNSGARDLPRRVVVNLAPADLRKEGPTYDLAIAVGLLIASGQLVGDTSAAVFLGELSLEGGVRHTQGVLPMTALARDRGITTVYVPREDAAEAALVEGVTVIPVGSLRELAAHLAGEVRIAPFAPAERAEAAPDGWEGADFRDIKGQEHVKRALEVAAAGGHNLIMSGPPGAGKTLMARALPGILPRMSPAESLEVTKIYSVAGRLPGGSPLIRSRPFRAPHHTISHAGLVGGGSQPRPGEISLAHRGVLFLDELPEFAQTVLEVLRQPLEDRLVTISRARGTVAFPANFMLVAAMNPCPCVGKYHSAESSCPGTGHHRPAPRRQGAKWRRPVEGPPLPQPLAGTRPTAPRLPRPLWRDADRGCPSDRCGRRLDGRPVGERRQCARGDPAGIPDRAPGGTTLARAAGGRQRW